MTKARSILLMLAVLAGVLSVPVTGGIAQGVTTDPNHVVGDVTAWAGISGTTGNTDGDLDSATFNDIRAMANDGTNLFVSEHHDNLEVPPDPDPGWLRKITPAGDVTTIANPTTPFGMAYVGGMLYLTDYFNGEILEIDPTAPTPTLSNVVSGLDFPWALTTDGTDLYFTENGCDGTANIKKLTLSTSGITDVDTFISSDPEECMWLPALVYDGGFLYGLDDSRIFKEDLAVPGSDITLVGGPDRDSVNGLDYPRGLEMHDGLLYLTTSQNTGHEMWTVDPMTGAYNRYFAGGGAMSTALGTHPGPNVLGIGVAVHWHPQVIHNWAGQLVASDRLEPGGPTGWDAHLIRKLSIIVDTLPPSGNGNFEVIGPDPNNGGKTIYEISNQASDDASGAAFINIEARGESNLAAAGTSTTGWRRRSTDMRVSLWGVPVRIKFADRSFKRSAWKTLAPPCIRIRSIQADPPGPDNGSAQSLNAEWVLFRNRCPRQKSMTGWKINDREGHTYKFPPTTLNGGGSLKLHTGRGTNSSGHRYWRRDDYIWHNTHEWARVLVRGVLSQKFYY